MLGIPANKCAPSGGQYYWANFYKAIPTFFTTIVVSLPIESELLRITKRESLPISKNYLAELRISGLFYGGTSVFRRVANSPRPTILENVWG